MADIPVIILAGGKGTRLQSVVSDRPKVLAEINGKPFLAYLLAQVVRHGFTQVIISTGYMAEQVEAALGHEFQGLRLAYSREDSPLGTGGGVRLAMQRKPAPLYMVLNGDSYCNSNLTQYVAWFRQRKHMASLLLARVDNTERYGRVETDSLGNVTSFVEKGCACSPGDINAGQYLLTPQSLHDPLGPAFSIEQEVFPLLLHKGLLGYSTKAEFIDIGTPESYASAASFFSTLGRK